MDASHDIGTDSIGRGCLRDTEIGKLYLSVCGNNDILRFYITVNNAPVVRRLKSEGNLDRNAGRFLDAQFSLPVDIIFQRDAFHKLHNDIVNTAVISHVEHVDYVRMGQSGSSLGFRTEFCDKGLVLTEFRLHHFDRNHTVQLMVHGFINICHSAGTDSAYNLISLA